MHPRFLKETPLEVAGDGAILRGQMNALLADCLRGDAAARNGFVDRYAPVIHGAVRRLVRSRVPDDPAVGAEDIVQQIFLRLFRDDARLLRTYDPDRASLTTWLTIVARSTTLDVLRKKRPDSVPFEAAVHSPVVDGPEPAEPEVTIPEGLLSPRQALVMKLLFDQERDVPEVAGILGIEEQTVRSAKHKALSKLRAFFAAGAGGENPRPSGDAKPTWRVQQGGGTAQ